MDYKDRQSVLVGDTVKYTNGDCGRVVASIDDGVYSAGCKKEDWAYLESGVLVLSERFGLTHYHGGVELDFELRSRGKTN